jgi:hypothetical protein
MAGSETVSGTSSAHKLTFVTLTAMVVGSMVGRGHRRPGHRRDHDLTTSLGREHA